MPKTARMLVAAVLALLALGLVMLASTSSVRGSVTFGDPHYFVKRQFVWLVLALGGMVLLARLDYHFWSNGRVCLALAGLSVVALTLVFVPKIGAKIGGSYRWLRLGPLSLQPSEFAKLATLIVLAAWMGYVQRRAVTFTWGLLFPMVGLGVVVGLMILEPDFGTTALTGLVGMLILYAGGTRILYLFVTGLIGLGGFTLAVLHNPVRMARIFAFVKPEAHPAAAHQLEQSKVAFISGGWFGVGLGNSLQKQLYLPEAHTDFIFAIIGEELGFIATGAVILLFVVILVCGLRIALKAVDSFGRLLAFGITMMTVVQAAINIGVVAGCLPTKGLALPFISYGGSCLIVSTAAIGILLNIARHVDPAYTDNHTKLIRDRAHRL